MRSGGPACPACGDSKCLCVVQARRIMLALSEAPEVIESNLTAEQRMPADGYIEADDGSIIAVWEVGE